jgi:hypothetical protein
MKRFFARSLQLFIVIGILGFIIVTPLHALGVADGITAPTIKWVVWLIRMAVMIGMVISTVVAVLAGLYFLVPLYVGRLLSFIVIVLRGQSK